MTDPFSLRPFPVAVVLGMATLTYVTKAGGLWALGRLSPPERVREALDALPGAIVVAVLAPAVVSADPPSWLAAGVVVAVARRTDSVLAALVAGVGTVLLFRGI